MSYYSIKLQLNDPKNYQGLSFISMISLLIMPLGLEVIFSHRELWFDQGYLWQQVSVDWCWRLWVSIGIICLSAWNASMEWQYSFDQDQWKLRLIFVLISLAVFMLSALPSFYWMMKMNLCGLLELMLKMINASLVLGATAISVLVFQYYFSAISNILLSSTIGFLMLWLVI